MIQEKLDADLTRRTFLKIVGGVGASFALGSFTTLACASGKAIEPVALEPNAFVRIDPDGTVTLTVARSEMGQGVRTSLAMLIAEEMDADWSKVKVVQAPGDSAKYGSQGTGGSQSVRGSYQNLRRMGATAKAMLVGAAAQTWSVDAAECKCENGRVTHSSGKSMAYGDLTTAAATIAIPANVTLKDPSEFKIIGKRTKRVDNPDVVRGTAKYTGDVSVPGMGYAVISRKPSFGAQLQSFDDAATRKVPGVTDVFKVSNGVAIVAKNTWAAMEGAKALKAIWTEPNADFDSAKLDANFKAAITDFPAMPDGAKVVEATLFQPYLAHATMETQGAVADVRADSCEVWAGTQGGDGAQRQVAQMLGIPATSVKVNVMLLGGGFGRRLSNDYVSEAVEISRQAKMPIKLLWTREDDMKNDNYRTASYHAFKGAVDSAGNPIAYAHQSVFAGGGGRGGGGAGFSQARIQYNIPDAQARQGSAQSPVSTGAWRSVQEGQMAAPNECFIDELAAAAGQDPYQFRRKLLRDERLIGVLDAVAKKAGWGTAMPKGKGRGIACFSGFASYAAHVVELTVDGDKIKIDRVVCAVDCGIAVNPLGVEAQVQGACSDGLSAALRAAITIEKGAVAQNSWYDYEWMTIDAMPKVEVVIVPSNANPTGMGEPGFPSVMPAVANAIFAATGKRVRKFPIKISELA